MDCEPSPSAEPGALGDPEFSDCTLRLCLDTGTSLLSPHSTPWPPAPAPAPASTQNHHGPPPKTTHRGRESTLGGRSSTVLKAQGGKGGTVQKTVLREVHVCTLVLAAKSEYFRILFSGRFAESARRERVDIHVPEGGETAFMDLLFYLYNGAMPEYLKHSVEGTLRLLAMSDLFETRDCFQGCLAMLMEGARSLTSVRDAVLFINLPPQLQDRPSLAPLVTAGKRCLVRAHSKLFRAPYREALYNLTEQVLEILLDSDDLEVESEDEVLEGAKSWVRRNFPESAGAVEALCRVVLPHVRHLSLSPRALLSLAMWEKETFSGIPDAPTPDPDSENFDAKFSHNSGLAQSSGVPVPGTGSGQRQGQGQGQRQEQGQGQGSTGMSGDSFPGGYSYDCTYDSPYSSPSSSSPPLLLPSPFHSPPTPSPLSLSLSPPQTFPLSHSHSRPHSQSPPSSSARTGQSHGLWAHQGHTCPSNSAAEGGAYPRHTACAGAIPSGAASEAAVQAHEASLSALLALSERCFLEGGCVPKGASLGGYMTGREWARPRVSCRPPTGRLYLDIPIQFCQPWLPSDEDLAASALTFVSGRWLVLKARYHSTPGTVGLWVSWHTDPAVSSQEKWGAKCRFCVMTESSSPAYQNLQSTYANFEVEVASWGLEGALSMGTILQEADYFFPEGALRIRADIWILS